MSQDQDPTEQASKPPIDSDGNNGETPNEATAPMFPIDSSIRSSAPPTLPDSTGTPTAPLTPHDDGGGTTRAFTGSALPPIGPLEGPTVLSPEVTETYTPLPTASHQSPKPADSSAAHWNTIRSGGQLQPGEIVFGRYVVQRKLGGGGMGEVWQVRHLELNAERAVKMILTRIASDSQTRGRFRREAQAMARFTHPNAVTVHDARLSEHDVAYIEMEYIEGQSLDKILQRGVPMPLDWTARILDQLCDVLQTAHEHQIVHRDLKPSNLMLVHGRPEGKELLKVLDFGIAKILGVEDADNDVRTLAGFFMGTPPYASPEQGDGKADPRSDIYAVGIILYEFLTGHRPFKGPAARMIADTLNTPAPPFATINPEVKVPPEIERLVLRCLAKDPKDRPQTIREVAEEFRRALPQPATIPVAPPAPRLNTWALISTILALGLLLLLAWLRPGETPKPILSQGGDGGSQHEAPGLALPPGFHAEKPEEPAEDGYPRLIVSDHDGSRFVRVVGGSFEMGPPGATRRVTVPSVYMQETEVTNAQLQTYFQHRGVVPTPPPRIKTAWPNTEGEFAQHPAVFVDHSLAEDYARWVGGRLMTSAEYEYAARSRGQPDHKYVWGDSPPLEPDDRRANIDALEHRTTTAKVTNYPDDHTNQGVLGLTGNVREWCQDRSPGDVSSFEVRGGSWKSFADEFATYRGKPIVGTTREDDLGFRVVVEWPKPTNGSQPASAE